jgi:hypothetical protein
LPTDPKKFLPLIQIAAVVLEEVPPTVLIADGPEEVPSSCSDR